ncbi:MAG: rhomboid family intramembrane serine protease [Melioribacteraceae bacterium]|nr:rhomboid family intramembrane serine protease [Melioribacteraceae bacterium]
MGLNDRDYYRPSGFGGFSLFPPVIKNLLIINGIVFFLQVLGQTIVIGRMLLADWITVYFGLIPIDFSGASFLPWQLLTYQFLHGDFGHIFFNMLMLWMFGMEIENYWGSTKFLVFYLLCGVVGGLFQIIVGPLLSLGAAPTIGASGAVYGVMVAFAMFFPDRYIFLYFLLPIKAKYLIAGIVLIEFMSVGEMSFVAHLVHLGGAFTAAVFIILDRQYNFNFDRWFNKVKRDVNSFSKSKSNTFDKKFRKPFASKNSSVEDADFYEINSMNETDEISQEVIDGILDKISRSGYQNLTEKEKRILFEASKKK